MDTAPTPLWGSPLTPVR